MRRVLGLLLFASCASGQGVGAGGDAGGQPIDAEGQQDAPIARDGDVMRDARELDARPIDARPIDAEKIIDARPDAEPIDARPIDARPDAAPDACVPKTTELLLNPAFDLTPVGVDWTQVPYETGETLISNAGAVDSPSYAAWLGGLVSAEAGEYASDQLYQDFAVPAGTTSLVLTGKYIVGTKETTTTVQYDTSSVDFVQTDGTPIEHVLSLSNLDNATGSAFSAFSYTFPEASIPEDTTVRLSFTSKNDYSNYTNFFYDTLTVTAIHCP